MIVTHNFTSPPLVLYGNGPQDQKKTQFKSITIAARPRMLMQKKYAWVKRHLLK